MYYVMLFGSAILFACQFLLTKVYEKKNGDSLHSSFRLTFFAYCVIALFFFLKASITAGHFIFGFSLFTFFITIGVGIISMICMFMGIKVLKIGNMSVYSVFMMIGSIILPSLTGIFFFKESFNFLKGIAFVLMLVSVVFSVGGGVKSISKKAIFYYIAVFVCNGLIGVLFTIHQNNPSLTACFEYVDGVAVSNHDVFMSWYGITTALLSIIALVVIKILNKIKVKKNSEVKEDVVQSHEKISNENKNSSFFSSKTGILVLNLLIALGYGTANGMGNYFIALATVPTALGASVTFPIINGGTILCSTLMGVFIYKEKMTWKTCVSLALVIISTILFMFAQG